MIIFRDHLFNVVCNIRTPKADGKISVDCKIKVDT